VKIERDARIFATKIKKVKTKSLKRIDSAWTNRDVPRRLTQHSGNSCRNFAELQIADYDFKPKLQKP